jgi:hypothetical protein
LRETVRKKVTRQQKRWESHRDEKDRRTSFHNRSYSYRDFDSFVLCHAVIVNNEGASR